MEPKFTHSWDITPKEAKAIQLDLRKRIRLRPVRRPIQTVTGVDVSFEKGQNRCFAAAVTFSYPSLERLEEVFVIERISFPYIPGFLTFREGPAIMKVLSRLLINPNVLILDGQGIAHPRRLGIASHIGVLYGIPSIGCAKSRLFGEYKSVGIKKGNFSDLLSNDGERLGVVLRTRQGVKPVFVSPGHLIDIQQSMDVVLSSAVKYRLPEPTRSADRLSKKAKKLVS